MVRVTNYFDTQIRIPIHADKVQHIESEISRVTNSAFQAHLNESAMANKPMSNEQLISWYGKILEGVKQRYRKLQRLARYVDYH